jgi:hypothetical protein
MKKIVLLLVLALGVFVLSACSGVASVAQGVVDLPNPVETGIQAVILVGVSWLLVQLVTLWKALAFLDAYKVPLAMAISAQLIGYIEVATPDAYGAVVIKGIELLLTVIALFVTAQRLKEQGVKGFK